MPVSIFDPSFNAVDIIDNYESLIWTERYDLPGDFEISKKFDLHYLDVFREDYYLKIPNSDRTMVVESINIKTNKDSGDYIYIKGRSLESTLDRRIVLRQIQIDTLLEDGIQAILNADVINSIYPERNFPNFIFSYTYDPLVTTPTLKGQFYSQNLLELICSLCRQAGLGFKVLLNDSNQFVFSLYAGRDHSNDQTNYVPVIFSKFYDNLTSSDYVQSRIGKKNYVLVSGDPTGMDGLPLRSQVWTSDVGTGLNRLEMFLDVSSECPRYIEGTSTPISDSTYIDQLTQKGKEALSANGELILFDGEVSLKNYVYRTDFNLGDLVQFEDNYGHSLPVRVVEMVFSENINGIGTFPVLKHI